jgi:hypothetical protein
MHFRNWHRRTSPTSRDAPAARSDLRASAYICFHLRETLSCGAVEITGLPGVSRAEMQARFTSRDRLANFIDFPGHPYGGMFKLPGIPRLEPDQLFRDIPDNAVVFTTMQKQIHAAFAHDGHVYIMDVFDPDAWDARWPRLYLRHVTKPVLFGFFTSHYIVRRLGEIAEIRLWELSPRATAAGVPSGH